MNFFIQWNEPPLLEGILSISPAYSHRRRMHPIQLRLLDKKDHELMAYFENEDTEKVEWRNLTVVMSSTQNLYQHFCYKKPEYKYRANLLSAICTSFTNIFRLESNFTGLISDVRKIPGLHIRTRAPAGDQAAQRRSIPYITDILVSVRHYMALMNQGNRLFIASDTPLAYSIAKRIFGDEYTIIYNTGPLPKLPGPQIIGRHIDKNAQLAMLDLLFLTRCKTLYIAWNSDFSRLAALLSPNRDFYCYEYPRCAPDMYKVPLDELLSYYIHESENT